MAPEILTELGLPPRYADVAEIGEGVSSKVYRAWDRETDSTVAIKLLNPHLRTDPISIERFRREVQITRHLRHPQIVSIYDFIETEDHVFLVMEYLSGRTLKEHIRLEAPLQPDFALGVLRQLMSVLAVCHENNVIHRDLKPQNMVLDESGNVRLLDFGIARITGLTDLTATGTSLGSPEYMAPELFATNSFDPRTDLYAAGIIAFEMLAGHLPFHGDSINVLYRQHLEAPVPDLPGDVPAWVGELLGRLLAKNRYERYQTALEVLADIDNERVLASSLPAAEKRECLECSNPTIDEIPVCIHCGYDDRGTLAPGTYDVTLPRDVDPGKLASLMRRLSPRVLSAEEPVAGRLLCRVDAGSAKRIQKSALEDGIYLSVARSLWPPRKKSSIVKTYLTFALFMSSLILFVTAKSAPLHSLLYLQAGYFIREGGSLLESFLYRGGDLFLLGAATVGSGLWAFRNRLGAVALVDDRPHLSRYLTRTSGWIEAMAPHIAQTSNAEMKTLVAGMVERYYLLRKLGAGLSDEVSERLVALLEGATKIARVISEIDSVLATDKVAAWSREYEAARARVGGEGELGDRARELGESLRAYYRLEEKREALVNRLIHVSCAFTTSLGRAVVYGKLPDETAASELASLVRQLEQDAQISREVQKELRDIV